MALNLYKPPTEVFGIFVNEIIGDITEENSYEGLDTADRLCHNLGVWLNETNAKERCEKLNEAEPSVTVDETYFVKSITIKD
jgi:hypothetical protein